MANEDEESNFAPVYKKYAEMQDAILAGVDKVHPRLERLNKAVGAEWIQPKRGKSILRKAYDYIKPKLDKVYNRTMDKLGLVDKLENYKELPSSDEKAAFRKLEKYNPKDSKGPGILDRLAPYTDKMFSKKPEKGKLSDYVELKDTLTEDERKKGLEELEKGQGMYLGEKLEKYDPKDSKGGYGIKAKLNDKLRDAIAKARSNGDKFENYAELEDTFSKPEATGRIIFAGAGEDAGERYVVGDKTIGLPITQNESKSLVAGKSYGTEARRYGLLGAGTEPKLRKSYRNEAATDALLKPVGINDRSQYAPESAGRPAISKEDNSNVIEKMRKNLKKGIYVRSTDEKYTTANAAGADQYVKAIHGK